MSAIRRRNLLKGIAAGAAGAAVVPGLAGVAVARPPIKGTVLSHFAAAYEAAGTEHVNLYNMLAPRLDNANAGKIATPPDARSASIGKARAAKVFDTLYYVGEKDFWESSASAWAIDTSDGIIIFDALYRDSGPILIEKGLREFGLDPGRITHVVISHAHGDHFGGARYLQDKYGARVAMSAEDWDYLEATTPPERRPVGDLELRDGQTLRLGGQTMTFYVTPGHTPGTLSTVFPVYDAGVRHVAAQWGGTGFGFGGVQGREKTRWFETYHASAVRFAGIVERAGADVLVANHPGLDQTYAKLSAQDVRAPGEPNPWVIGASSVQGYVTTAAECAAAGAVAAGPSGRG